MNLVTPRVTTLRNFCKDSGSFQISYISVRLMYSHINARKINYLRIYISGYESRKLVLSAAKILQIEFSSTSVF